MKMRLVLAITEEVWEDTCERHYKTVDVDVVLPDEMKKCYKDCDILGGQWLPEKEDNRDMEKEDDGAIELE